LGRTCNGLVPLCVAEKFAAGQAERGGGWLRLVFRLSASSMEQDYAGLLDAMLGKSAGRAPSCADACHKAERRVGV
jgi:hypothetical protein